MRPYIKWHINRNKMIMFKAFIKNMNIPKSVSFSLK